MNWVDELAIKKIQDRQLSKRNLERWRKQNKTLREIAEICGVCIATISNRLRFFNLQTTRLGRKSKGRFK